MGESNDILKRLQDKRLPDFNLGGEFLYPAYDGLSILNIPAGVCALLGAPPLGEAAPLDPALLAPLGGPYQRVILILVDGLAYHRLQRWLAAGETSPAWSRLAAAGALAPLTSIIPSTTTAALTTLWTGRSPAEHGYPGYELFLKEYGLVTNMIQHRPIAFHSGVDTLENAGFKPEDALALPTFGAHLRAQGVTPLAYQHRAIQHSTLSRMLLRDVEQGHYFTPSDLFVKLRRRIEQRPDERLYAYLYWEALDTFGHYYGPDDERSQAEFAAFGDALQRLLLERLSPELRRGTLLIVTADHGQLTTTPDDYYNLDGHPNLTRRLHMLPTGEGRLAYLYARPGQLEAVREYIQRAWPNQFIIVDSAYAADAGLFGPGAPHPALLERIGDLIVIAKGNAYLWWANKRNQLIGRHGGLHPDEMLVPFLAAPLDADRYFT